jgi:hypothetical protein
MFTALYIITDNQIEGIDFTQLNKITSKDMLPDDTTVYALISPNNINNALYNKWDYSVVISEIDQIKSCINKYSSNIYKNPVSYRMCIAYQSPIDGEPRFLTSK